VKVKLASGVVLALASLPLAGACTSSRMSKCCPGRKSALSQRISLVPRFDGCRKNILIWREDTSQLRTGSKALKCLRLTCLQKRQCSQADQRKLGSHSQVRGRSSGSDAAIVKLSFSCGKMVILRSKLFFMCTRIMTYNLVDRQGHND